MENISVMQSTPVPVELRELVTTYNSQEQLSTSIPETTFTSLPSHSPAEFRDTQIADPVISRFHYYRQNNRTPPPRQERRGETRDAVTLLNQWDKVEEENGLLYQVTQDPHCGQRKQLIHPQKLKEKVLTSLHDGMGHHGSERTLHLIRDRCYLPGIHSDVQAWIKKCEKCTLFKEPLLRVRPAMGHLLATRALEVLAIDSV